MTELTALGTYTPITGAVQMLPSMLTHCYEWNILAFLLFSDFV